ncbi:histidine kinase [Novosphingobium barchaimii LL02]|uniref:Histidine kinase n=1 Tax=Novosphingobium barchaimii LL02 TaxID=1114963 RepID=A0A0J7XH80_9SPHN|nr:response regulator [Novosphingobium barchaimii]KMS51127.1 histidine kinase [Novosphingobium barchaimii LL02]
MPKNWRTRLGSILGPNASEDNDFGAEYAVERAASAELPKATEAGAFQSVEPVLIVDDDADWGKECAFSLRQMGYEPFVATSADEALALFVDHDISIAIVDYNLPGLDGITLIQEMAQQAEAEGRQLRFIMATGYATKDVAIDAMRASAIDFLEKPISQSDLRRALQRIRGLAPAPGARKVLIDKISNLSTELQRLAHLMDEPGRSSAPAEAPVPSVSSPLPGGPVTPEQLTVFIRDQLRRETKRRAIGGGELFGDPAWAMMLDLLLAKIEKRQVSVSSACIASGAPMSTALRLVRRLVDEEVLCRLPDEHDRRRHFLAINPKCEKPLVDYLTEQVRQRG